MYENEAELQQNTIFKIESPNHEYKPIYIKLEQYRGDSDMGYLTLFYNQNQDSTYYLNNNYSKKWNSDEYAKEHELTPDELCNIRYNFEHMLYTEFINTYDFEEKIYEEKTSPVWTYDNEIKMNVSVAAWELEIQEDGDTWYEHWENTAE